MTMTLDDLLMDGRTGWKLVEREPGRWVAWRTIDVLDQPFTLIVDPLGRLPLWWHAECRDSDGTVVAELHGRREDVAAVHGLIRTLSLATTLRECRSAAAAADVLARLDQEQLDLLRLALGLPSDLGGTPLRRAILGRVCPGRFDPSALTRSTRW